jgi:hypothetical protein
MESYRGPAVAGIRGGGAGDAAQPGKRYPCMARGLKGKLALAACHWRWRK